MKKETISRIEALGPKEGITVDKNGAPYTIYYSSPRFYVVRGPGGNTVKFHPDIYWSVDDLQEFFK